MKTVYVIGTGHRYQGTFNPPLAAVRNDKLGIFKQFLKEVIHNYNIRSVGEEMSKEALDKYAHPDLPRGQSILFQVARELHLPHEYCDPDSATKKKLGITDDDTEGDDGRREAYWLKQVEEFSHFPSLFICGPKHSRSFHDLLASSGFTAKILAEEWTLRR